MNASSKRSLRFGVASTGICLAALVACAEDPTEVVVKVYSDVPCDARVALAVGRAGNLGDREPSAVSTVCHSDGSRGTLVLIPKSEQGAELSVEARIRADQGEPEGCLATNDYTGCIVARRILNYIPGRTVHLRIDLRNPCLNTPCSQTTTCIAQGTTKSCLEAKIDVSKCVGTCTEETLVTQSIERLGPCSVNPCRAGAECKVQDGGAACVCPAGFEHPEGDALSCGDVDECTKGLADCDEHASCTNTEGSFTCACNEGYSGVDGKQCAQVACATACGERASCKKVNDTFECVCDAGYAGDGSQCNDIDECATGADSCDPLVACTNTPGSFECGGCPTGYRTNGTTCVDVDECTENLDSCDPLVGCVNQPGSYSCTACPAQYVDTNGDGKFCADIDECATNTDNCDANVACNNTVGGFTCGMCPSGYTDVNANGTLCADIDECATNTDNCDANVACNNTVGGFTCGMCPSGYTDVNANGTLCTDIDECTLNLDNCASNATCTNTAGKYTCTCPPGSTDVNANGTLCTCVNAVPAMTSATAPSGTASASGSYGTGYEGWRALDGKTSDIWISEENGVPAWLRYDWPGSTTKTIRRYSVAFSNGTLISRAPRDWTLQGSNDGTAWTIVDTRAGQTNWASGVTERREFVVASPGAYGKYRLVITEDNDARAGSAIVVISLAQVELFECI